MQRGLGLRHKQRLHSTLSCLLLLLLLLLLFQLLTQLLQTHALLWLGSWAGLVLQGCMGRLGRGVPWWWCRGANLRQGG